MIKLRERNTTIFRLLLLFQTVILLFLFGGCEKIIMEDSEKTDIGYVQISSNEAKRIMDSEEDCVIIDARTQAEFAEGHIEGAILIPEYEIIQRVEGEIPDKDTLILVYCRSGRRSKIASEALVELGYTNVKEFGGIIDWPYEIVE